MLCSLVKPSPDEDQWAAEPALGNFKKVSPNAGLLGKAKKPSKQSALRIVTGLPLFNQKLVKLVDKMAGELLVAAQLLREPCPR